MTIFLDKLLSCEKNKYLFSRAAMLAIDKVANIKDYPEVDDSKVVSNILNLLLDDKVKYELDEEGNEQK